jgi:hypothetical protein
VGALPERFGVDPDEAARLASEGIQDPLVRDLLFLRVSREVDPGGGRWCNLIGTAVLADRCRVLARRPHLSRGLPPEGSVSGDPEGPKQKPAP